MLGNIPEIEVILTVLNKAGLRMSGSLKEMERATRRIYEAGKAVYIMKVLGRGKLAANIESALNYVYKLPYVHSVSIGMKSLDELETNVRIVNKL
jgi:predicted aldo/keto reductase-like oxidoreductase